MNVLVTGGSGFIGSHVVETLLNMKLNVTVSILDIETPGKISHLEDKVSFKPMDIRNISDCRNAIKDIDIVIHLAALINVDHSIQDPIPFYETNVHGTMNILEAVRNEPKVKKFVYMSTAEVYGNCLEGKLKETDLCDPRSPYAASKYAAERYCLSFSATYKNPEITIIRGFNTFGPRQTYGVKGAVIAIFINDILNGKSPMINGDGSQIRDYIYVEDLAEGIARVATTFQLDGEIINLTAENPITINTIANKILEIHEAPFKPQYRNARPGEVVRSCGDGSKARKLLSWKPKYSFHEGLEKTIKYFESD